MPSDFPMTSSRPYIIRSLYAWIIDNDATPYLMVDAGYEGTLVPMEYVDESNQIVLNVSPTACQDLSIGNAYIEFSARFSGKSMHVTVPVGAVMGIYARENGQGMIFGQEPGGDLPPQPDGDPSPEDKPPKKPRPDFLKVVK